MKSNSAQCIPFSELAEFYSKVGNFITNYTSPYISQDEIKMKYSNYQGLTYPASSLLKRVIEFYHNSELPFLHVWDEITLRNVMMTDREFIRRDLRNRGHLHVERYKDNDLICLYFGQYPDRNQLIDYITDMVNTEYDIAPVGDELPIGSLMMGIFYLPGYQRMEDDKWIPVKGNLHLLSPNDLATIGYLLGTSLDAPCEVIEQSILDEQNRLSWELLQKGYTERRDGYSMIEMIIQRKIPLSEPTGR